MFEKNKINKYFPIIRKEDKSSISESIDVSSPLPNSVSPQPQNVSTPNPKNISIYETPDTSHNGKKRKVSQNSLAISPKVISTENDEQLADYINSSKTSDIFMTQNDYSIQGNSLPVNRSLFIKEGESLNDSKPNCSIDLTEKEPLKTIEPLVEGDVSTEEDLYTAEEDLGNLSLNSSSKLPLTRDNSISEENTVHNNMSVDNKDSSIAENDQSMLDEDESPSNTTSKEDDHVFDHNETTASKGEEESMLDHNETTASKEDESMLDEDESDYSTTSSKADGYVLDHNTTASKDQSMLDDADFIDDGVSDIDDGVSDHNTSATSEDSVESKDQTSFKDNVESTEDVSRRLSEIVKNDSSPKNASSMHLQSDDSPSYTSPIPKANSSEQDLKTNVKNADISFDLNSSLYDQPCLSEQVS